MCFYHHQSWTCGRWQWGALAKRCHQGAVDPSACGLKLIYNGLEKKHSCPNCKQHRKADHDRRMAAASIGALNPETDLARIYELEADVRRLDAKMAMLTKEHQGRELIPKEPINMRNVDGWRPVCTNTLPGVLLPRHDKPDFNPGTKDRGPIPDKRLYTLRELLNRC